MKIIFRTPDIPNMIESICLRYKEKTNDVLIHPYIMIRVNKDADDWLIDDMKHVITISSHVLQGTTIVEAIEDYHISMSILDLQTLCCERLSHHVFISELGRITKDMQSLSTNTGREPVECNPKLDFQILDDMRLFSNNYMRIYNSTDLSREELNSLYRITVRFKVPIYMIPDMCKKFKLNTITDADSVATNYRLSKCDNNNDITFQLSSVANAANINPDLATFTTNPDKIMRFIDYACKCIHNSDVEKLTQLGTFSFITVSITISELIQFLNPIDQELSDTPRVPKYYEYLNALSQLLLYNNIFMEFILLGKERR